MNVNTYNKTDYENKSNWTLGQNKPNSKPIKPNLRKAKMNVNLYVIEDYRKKDDFAVRKNKPNSNPISEKPKMSVNLYIIEDYENETAFRPKKTNPNKPNFKPDAGFSPQVRLETPYGGVPGTAYYTRDCTALRSTRYAARATAPSFLACLCDSRCKTRQQTKARWGPRN